MHTATGERKARTARGIRAAAAVMADKLPAIQTPGHLRDAAREIERGNHAGTRRHLMAAMNTLSPLQLYRHGVHDDDGHTTARQMINTVHRLMLQARDIEDIDAANRAGQQPRQPPGDQALNAPDRVSAGPPDGTANGPKPPPPMSGNLSGGQPAIELAGPKGYVHGWKYVGTPGGAGMTGGADIGAALGPAATAAGRKIKHLFSGTVTALRAHMAARHGGAHNTSDPSSLHAMHDFQHQSGQADHQHQMAVAQAATGRMLGMSWDDVITSVELSAQTARLAVTPAPYGKPGGPGLYDVKGMGHSPYFQQLVKAFKRRGMDDGRASAMAWGALRRWSKGGGDVHPEVQAAAAGALAIERAKGAAARAAHGH